MSKLTHYELENHFYFITTTTLNRQPFFEDPENAEILWNVILNQLKRRRFHLVAFVIMPDHLHIVINPTDNIKPSFVMQEIKKGSSRLINMKLGRRGKVWLDEYYDYVVRDENKLIEKLEYIHRNPVRKGLVTEDSVYKFSSANEKYTEHLLRKW